MSTTKRYLVALRGCDERTEFSIELTAAELETVKRIAAASDLISQFGCMPTLTVGSVPDRDGYDTATVEV